MLVGKLLGKSSMTDAIKIFFQDPKYNVVFRKNGVALLPIQTANIFASFCRKQKIFVLGIEGFIISNDKLIPQMEAIVDFSSIVNKPNALEENHNMVSKFLESFPKSTEIMFEFILST